MPTNQREIFSIVGLPPEVLAVAMAKYSHSPFSIKDTIEELAEEKPSEFQGKLVLGYGDASVADMAVVAMAFENVSIFAAKVIEDNRIAAYQEKSTRYQPFSPERFYRPASIMASPHAFLYEETVGGLFKTYQAIINLMVVYYKAVYPKPPFSREGLPVSDNLYTTKLRARALDVARYILPTATLTNFGIIASARTLRHAISKCLASPLKEAQEIGHEMEQAATVSVYNPQIKKIDAFAQALRISLHQDQKDLLDLIFNQIKLQMKGAPILLKRSEARQYLLKKKETAKRYVKKYLQDIMAPLKTEPRVDFLAGKMSLEDELVATLLYPETTLSFRAIINKVQKLDYAQKREIIDAVQKERSIFDGPSREFEVGKYFMFDMLFDCGAFRDIQRHRLYTQINQPLSMLHGYEIPRDLEAAGGLSLFQEAILKTQAAYNIVAKDFPSEARYMIPMAFRKRTLFKMDLRELYHIIELRSKSGGHFSYRTLVYEMYEELKKYHPLLAEHIRAIKMNFAEDFFKR